MRINILGVKFDNLTCEESLKRLLAFLEGEGGHILCTPNPEMVMAANKDTEFMRVLNKADLVVPDGIGIVLASRLFGRGLKERVAGCDLVLALFDAVKDSGKSVYLLGGKPGIVELAAKNMRKKYQGLNIVGHHHGYFANDEEPRIIEEITQLQPDILLVGLGMARQEKWIYRNRGLAKLSAGVGGSLDVMSGTVRRAPSIFRRLGLEWFYRLIQQPSRIGRMLILPVFAAKVLVSEFARPKKSKKKSH